MTSNANVRQYADELSDVMIEIEAQKIKAAAIVDAAKEANVCPKTLRKVAKELITDSSKLAKKYADEEQLDMFRAQVGIFKRKGLDETDKAAASAKVANTKKLKQSAKELDAMLGTNLAGNYDADQRKVNAYVARSAEHD